MLLHDIINENTGKCKKKKKTLARQRVLSSSEVRASDLEHGGSWVRIPSGAQIFFCVLLHLPVFFLKYINQQSDSIVATK